MNREALRRIEQAAAEGWEELDLAGLEKSPDLRLLREVADRRAPFTGKWSHWQTVQPVPQPRYNGKCR